MNEIPKILEPKERVIYEGKPRYAPYMVLMVFGSLIAGIVLGVAGGFFFNSLLIGSTLGILFVIVGPLLGNLGYSRTHYAITNKRVIIQTGIIGRDFRSVDYDRMQNVSVDVGLLGILFHVGTIRIFTGEMESVSTGDRGTTIRPSYDNLQYLAAPYDVLKLLQTNLSKRKEQLA